MTVISCGDSELIRREEKIRFSVSGWNSLRCTPTVRIRPEWVVVEYTNNSFIYVKVIGRRINTAGLGATHERTMWGSEWPDWLATEVRKRTPEWWQA